MDLNGEKAHKVLLGPDVDAVNFVSDSETIKRLLYNNGVGNSDTAITALEFRVSKTWPCREERHL